MPEFIRDHLAVNNQPYVGGYFIGSETYIPAKDYFTRLPSTTTSDPSATPDWSYAFQRQWLYYKLWGRLLYNPATPDSLFRNEFMIHHPPADPDYMSVEKYIDTLLAGGTFTNRITPLVLANQLETDCRKALALTRNIDDPSLRYEVADIRTWAWLGLHFAHQLRGAVALEKFRRKGDPADQQQAITHLRSALKDWDTLIAITRPLYNDMPLPHLSKQGGIRSKENAQLRWHWAITRLCNGSGSVHDF